MSAVAATVSNPSAEASNRSTAEDEPAPQSEKIAVAAIDLQPRQAKRALPVAGAGSSVVKETSAETPVSFWSFRVTPYSVLIRRHSLWPHRFGIRHGKIFSMKKAQPWDDHP